MRSSVHVNLAGLLEQMEYLEDSLSVMHGVLDAQDLMHNEATSNIAIGYMMVAQLELRLQRLDDAEAALKVRA